MIVKIPPNTIIWIGFIRGDPTGSNSAASPWKTKQAYNKTRNEDLYTEPALIEKVHYPFMKLDDSLTFRNCESSKSILWAASGMASGTPNPMELIIIFLKTCHDVEKYPISISGQSQILGKPWKAMAKPKEN